MRRTLSALVLALAAMTPSVASAQLVEISPNCDVAVMTPTYAECGGAFAGNDGTSDVLTYIATHFGLTDVLSAGKSDAADSGPFKSNPGGSTGTLNFDVPINGSFVLSLKAGSNFSLYFFENVSNLASVDFSTYGVNQPNRGGNVNALSHATLYMGDETFFGECTELGGCITTTPEPSTYALMGTGLFAVGFVSRRRRRTA